MNRETIHPYIIPFSSLEWVRTGNYTDTDARTGVTVFHFPNGADAAADISGGGPASRETPVLDAHRMCTPVNAIVLSGGSTFGLAASDGVVRCLREHSVGLDLGIAVIPIVCQSCIFDLRYGRVTHPDAEAGYAACMDALGNGQALSGCFGAGTGATIGKAAGLERAQKAGIGFAAARIGDLTVGAAVVVNALGDVYYKDRQIGGLLDRDRREYCGTAAYMLGSAAGTKTKGFSNTTLGVIFTNADLDRAKLEKVASMTRNAYARCISPVGTLDDGDTIYAVSGGRKVKADTDITGIAAALVMEEAIRDAVESSRIPDKEYMSLIDTDTKVTVNGF